jgi:DNA-binding transcriptional LysR family regulator
MHHKQHRRSGNKRYGYKVPDCVVRRIRVQTGIYAMSADCSHQKRFLLAYPKMRINLTLSDCYVDPIAAGYDIAIRVDEPHDTAQSSLVARKVILSSHCVLCASPRYLKRRGMPVRPSDLVNHSCLSYSYLEKPFEWRLKGQEGESIVKVSGPLATSHGQILKAAVLRDLGIAYAPRYFLSDAINEGDVQVVLPEYKAPDVDIYSVFPKSKRISMKVRVFNDFIGRFFSSKESNSKAQDLRS